MASIPGIPSAVNTAQPPPIQLPTLTNTGAQLPPPFIPPTHAAPPSPTKTQAQTHAFMVADLARSGLVAADFDLAPPPTPASITLVNDVVPLKGTMGGIAVEGYAIAYPTPMHDGHIKNFIVKRYHNHPDHKYHGPTGMTSLYWASSYPTWLRANVKFLVEGEKKALAVVKYLGAVAAGMRGCWGHVEDGKLSPALLESIKPGNFIYVLLDGDFVTHPDIRLAAATLARQIVALGAIPVHVVFPNDAQGRRMGADDWIMSQTNRTQSALRAEFDELEVFDWRELPEAPQFAARRLHLMTTGGGASNKPLTIVRNEENTATILQDQFGPAALFTDQYKGPMFAPWGRTPQAYTDDTLDSTLFRYLERSHGTWSKDAFRSCRRAMVGTTKRNLLGEQLSAIVWDKTKRIDTMLTVYFKVRDSYYVQKVSRGYLMGAVARLLDPGSKWDHVLILEGKQRAGKSYGLEVLHYSYLANIKFEGSKDNIARQCTSVWCACCDELDHLGKVGREAFKTWISERFEQWVPKYIEYAKETPRPFVIAGTTNEATYLDDPTGAERFWPVIVGGKVDHAALIRDRDQIWAEAIHEYKAAGPDWWMTFENDKTGAGAEQAGREKDDVLAAVIAAAMKTHTLPTMTGGREFVTMYWLNNIAQSCTLPANRKTQPLVLDACRRVGLVKLRVSGGVIDQASLGVPCQPNSGITVGTDQFHLAHVPNQFRAYAIGVMFEGDDGEL